MRYMLLICSDDKNAPPAPRAEMEVIIQGHRRFSDELQAAGKMVVGSACARTATPVASASRPASARSWTTPSPRRRRPWAAST